MAVGPVIGADGSIPASGRQGKTGEAIVAHAHGRYYEPSSRAVVFSAGSQGVGVAPGTALGTTALFALYNPVASGKRLAILRASIGYVSGTLGAGVILHCANPFIAGTAVAAPSSGTLLTNYCTNIGNQSGAASVAVARTGATVTTPLAVLGAICSLQASLASTAVAPWQVIDDVGGLIVVEPGFCYQIQSVAAAGSTPLVTPSVTWEEITIAASNG